MKRNDHPGQDPLRRNDHPGQDPLRRNDHPGQDSSASRQSHFPVRPVLGVIAGAMGLLLIVLNIREFFGLLTWIVGLFMPLLIGLCIAFILNVPMRFIEEKALQGLILRLRPEAAEGRLWQKMKRPISLLITLILVLGVIAFVLAMVVPNLKDTVAYLLGKAPEYGRTLRAWSMDAAEALGFSESLENFFALNQENVLAKVWDFLSGAGSGAAKAAAGVAAGVFSGLANGVLGLIFALYVLAGKETLSRQIKRVMTAWLPEKWDGEILRIGRLSSKVFSAFVTGQCLEAVVIGVLTCLGALLINPGFAVMLGVVVGFLALIPVVGAIGGILVGALLLVLHSPWQALAFVVFIILLQQLDNHIIYPRIIGKSVGLSGIWVLLAVLVGGSAGGILGIIVGVPLTSVLYALVRDSAAKRIRQKELKAKLQ